MQPILLEVESLGITIYTYGAFIALAVTICFALAIRMARREKLPRNDVVETVILMGISMFLGMKLHYVLTHPEWGGLFSLDSLLHGGVHTPGGFLLMAIVTPLVLRWKRIDTGRFADAMAPAVGVGIAVSRVGCFFAGCCYGKLCSLPWAISFPARSLVHLDQVEQGLVEATAASSLPVHPTQLYFALEGLGLAVVAIALRRYKRYDGQIALICLFLYAIGRSVLEPLRGAASGMPILGLPQLQFLGIAMAIGLGVLLVALELRHGRLSRS